MKHRLSRTDLIAYVLLAVAAIILLAGGIVLPLYSIYMSWTDLEAL